MFFIAHCYDIASNDSCLFILVVFYSFMLFFYDLIGKCWNGNENSVDSASVHPISNQTSNVYETPCWIARRWNGCNQQVCVCNGSSLSETVCALFPDNDKWFFISKRRRTMLCTHATHGRGNGIDVNVVAHSQKLNKQIANNVNTLVRAYHNDTKVTWLCQCSRSKEMNALTFVWHSTIAGLILIFVRRKESIRFDSKMRLILCDMLSNLRPWCLQISAEEKKRNKNEREITGINTFRKTS